ncbi:MAG: hypothetical protein C5B50_12390 [Verrucomicrobia bacterium]|nr:MAG: hypothetical protein C5B50_12390 [Verrucomicrobiota bacterium]
MPQSENCDFVIRLLREAFCRECSSGFAWLRRTPSTSSRKFLDYFASLNDADKSALMEALVQHATLNAFPH